MTNRVFVSALAAGQLFLFACGPSLVANEDAGADASAQCAFDLGAPATTRVGAGSALRFRLTGTGSRTNVEVRSMPEGAWGFSDAPFNEVVVRAPYTASGAVTVVVDVTCEGGARAQRTAMIDVRAPQWNALPTWNAGENGPLGREYGSLWIDAGNPDRMLVYGGFVYVPQQFTPAFDWWEYSFTQQQWTAISSAEMPPGLPGGRLALARETGQALYFGGLRGQRAPQATHRVHYGSGTARWEAINVMTSRPVGDYQPGLIYDAPRSRFLSFCGTNTEQGYHCNVWSFDTNTQRWTLSNDQTSEELPEGRAGFSYAHDTNNHRVVVFGGDRGDSVFPEGTWQLDVTQSPPRWSRITTTGDNATPRRNAGFAFDPDEQRLLVWGGTNDGRTSIPGLFMLTLDRGHEHWTRFEVPNGPRIRTSSMIAYDRARKRFVMGFGNGPQPFADLWALTL